MKFSTTLLSALLVGMMGQSRAKDWEVIEKGDHSYVTVGNIHEFYDFEEKIQQPGTRQIFLNHPNLVMIFDQERGESDIHINQVRYRLRHPLLWDAEKKEILVSTVDLVKIIDPVTRPQFTLPIAMRPVVHLVVGNPPAGVQGGALENALWKSGWKLSDDAADTDLHLRIIFVGWEGGAPSASIHTIFPAGRGRLPLGGLDTSHRLSLHFATSIHSRILERFEMDDSGLEMKAADPVPSIYKAEVEIKIVDPEGEINHADLNEVIAAAMTKVVELHNAPPKQADR